MTTNTELTRPHVTPLRLRGLLTPREVDILQCRYQGKSLPETAEYLGISLSTVSAHIGNLHRQYRARNLPQLMRAIEEAARVHKQKDLLRQIKHWRTADE